MVQDNPITKAVDDVTAYILSKGCEVQSDVDDRCAADGLDFRLYVSGDEAAKDEVRLKLNIESLLPLGKDAPFVAHRVASCDTDTIPIQFSDVGYTFIPRDGGEYRVTVIVRAFDLQRAVKAMGVTYDFSGLSLKDRFADERYDYPQTIPPLLPRRDAYEENFGFEKRIIREEPLIQPSPKIIFYDLSRFLSPEGTAPPPKKKDE